MAMIEGRGPRSGGSRNGSRSDSPRASTPNRTSSRTITPRRASRSIPSSRSSSPRRSSHGAPKQMNKLNIGKAVAKTTAQVNQQSSSRPSIPAIESHRAAAMERQRYAIERIDWAMKGNNKLELENALHEGLENGVHDTILERGLVKISEIEERAQAELSDREQKEVIRGMPLKPLFREGSLVKLYGLSKGVSSGTFAVALQQYNGRMGRVVEDPPAWLMKASGGSKDEGLVAVLLDSRSTDKDRSRGVWVAVPPSHLKIQ